MINNDFIGIMKRAFRQKTGLTVAKADRKTSVLQRADCKNRHFLSSTQ